MQPSTNVNIAAVQTEQVILAQHPQSTLNVPVIQALAIMQIVVGALDFILGIILIAAISDFTINAISFGIWFGVWIMVTGIIGIFSACKPQSEALNRTNMGFSIVCSVVSVIIMVVFAAALVHYSECREHGYITRSRYDDYYGRPRYTSLYHARKPGCKNKSGGIAIYSLLMLLVITEFFVSLFISIFCCKGNCCSCCSCCGKKNNDQRGMLQQHVGYSANGSAFTTTNTGYPQAAYAGTAIKHSIGAPVVFPTCPQQSQMMVPQNPQGQDQMMLSQKPHQTQMMVLQNPQQQGQMKFSQNTRQSQIMVPQSPQQGQTIVSQPEMTTGQTNPVHVSSQQLQQPRDDQNSQRDCTDINTPQ